MALTPSTMMPIGTAAPDFALPDAVSGRTMTAADLRREKGLLVMFICNHCPFVIHMQEALVKFGGDYKSGGIGVAAINANDIKNYPDDSPENMKRTAEKHCYPFPYLFDETQKTAKAYGAACTPDFFLFDSELKCAYRGQFDGARPGDGKTPNGADLRRAMDLLLEGKPVPAEGQTPSIGCSIKWKV